MSRDKFRYTLCALAAVVALVVSLPVLLTRGHSKTLRAQILVSKPSLNLEDPFCSSLLPVAQKGVSDNLTVHVVVVNRGVMRLFENLLCSLERVFGEPARVAVLGMDADTCPFLTRLPMFSRSVCIPYVDRMMKQLEVFEPLSFAQAVETGSLRESEKFGTVAHKVLINAKLYATRDVLACGFASFTTDVDVVFFKDALTYFNSAIERKPSLTMLFQKDQNEQNYQLDINSGFFITLNTPASLRFFTDCLTKTTWWHIDQSRVNAVMASGNHTDEHSWTLLPIDEFPVGDQVLEHERNGSRYNSSALVSGHANWSGNMGRKFHMLVTVGWWFTNFSSHQCLEKRDLPASFDIRDFWPNCTDKLWDCVISDR